MVSLLDPSLDGAGAIVNGETRLSLHITATMHSSNDPYLQR
jgi:hypothetical protein